MVTSSVSELISNAIHEANRPIRFREIRDYVKNNYAYPANDGTVRTVLCTLVRNSVLKRVKYPHRSSFYGKPEWFTEEGGVKPEIEFSPYYKQTT